MKESNPEAENNTGPLRRCGYCAGEVADIATVCRHCQHPLLTNSKFAGLNRWLINWKLTLEVSTFIGSFIVIIFLWITSVQTKNALKIQEKAIEIQSLQLKKTDSSLSLVNIQLLQNNKALGIQEQFNRMIFEMQQNERIRLIEELKPKIDLSRIDCYVENGKLKINYNLDNVGNSPATNVSLLTVSWTDGAKTVLKNNRTGNSSINHKRGTVVTEWHSMQTRFIQVMVTWEWKKMKLADTLYKPIVLKIDTSSNSCKHYYMSISQSAKFWPNGFTFRE